MKVLIVDDDPDVVEVVSLCFEMRWPNAEVVSASDGAAGLQASEAESPDLIILDIGLPDIDGLEVCRRIRRYSDVPVVMLTVRDQETDIVRGLEMGADDYITKPFSHLELLARIQAVLRRVQALPMTEDEKPYNKGNLYIDFARREVFLDKKPIKLTPTEYHLLYHLVRNEGRVVTHSVLLEKVWGKEYSDAAEYLKVHIQHIRHKLEDDGQAPRLILTERGVGYKFANLNA